ncbi:MAG TPA: exodeoxyribonuclease VII large subunit [Desulfonatronum sp.]|nr:exodeoxyribonuclease VII large subunit [Desulfonatronum sp.]
MAHIFSVRELTQAVKATLEGEFPIVWVRGQVSNLSRPGSGHVYFTLKDGEACLAAVWFKSQQWQPAAARAALANGQEVVCAGRLTVYPPRGTYQLVVEMVQDQGLGVLFLEFEALKRRLAGLGFFDHQRKRPLPGHPVRTAVVTAPGGAAIRDFLRLAAERGYGAAIRIHPVLVQGDEAPGQIIRAMDEINAQGWAEVIVLIRGGGSLEDLWTFNNEDLARTIFNSAIPVLTGIGHETDTSIADLVADMYAATPSHAAQLLWPERRVLAQMVDNAEGGLRQFMRAFLGRREEFLSAREQALSWLSPKAKVSRALERLHDLETYLVRMGRNMLERREADLAQLRRSLAQKLDERFWQTSGLRLEQAEQRVIAAVAEALRRREQVLVREEAALIGLDPVRPLDKGFCLVELPEEKGYLRDAAQASPGDEVRIIPRKGQLVAEVLRIRGH